MWKSQNSPGFAKARAEELRDEVARRFKNELKKEHKTNWEDHVTEEHFVRHLQDVVTQGKEHKKSDGKSFNILSLRAMRDELKRRDRLPKDIAAELNDDNTTSARAQTNATEATKEQANQEIKKEEAETNADKAAEKEAETRKNAEEAEIEAYEIEKEKAKAEERASKAEIKSDKAAARQKVLDETANWRQKNSRQKGFVNLGALNPISGHGTGDGFFALVLMFISLALAVVDYWFLHFGGLDYNIYLNAWKAGGLELIFRTFVPIYVLALLLVINLIAVAKQHKIAIYLVILFGLLFTARTITAQFGITIIPVVELSISIVALISAMAFSWFRLMDDDEKGRFLSYVTFLLIFSSIISLGGVSSIAGRVHLLIALLVWFFVKSEKDIYTANYWVAVLLAIDFFGFGILQGILSLPGGNEIIINRFVIPIWFLFMAVYSLQFKNSKIIKIIVGFVIIFYFLALVDGYNMWVDINAQMKANPDEIAEAKSFFRNAFANIAAIPDQLKAEWNRGIEQATGGYYQGKVEENQDPRNGLGVHIDNLQAADKEFYQNEEVIVWGELLAKTLEDPIDLSMSCESGTTKGTIKPDKLSDPLTKHTIQKLEQVPFECRFAKDDLKVGTNNIIVKAEFNFNTLGYLKTYFMDIERMRALRKDNVNPLTQYGIDKVPKAIYTNGPVTLGMGTIDPPIGLSTTSEGYSYVGITVQPQWYGKIKNITSVQIQVPIGLDIKDPGKTTFCRDGFIKIEDNKEGYSIYNMTWGEIKKIKTPIDTYKSWRCSISIASNNAPDILGKTPIATHYYRAEVHYIYEIEKSTTVYIKGAEGTERMLSGCEIECDDVDGCICNSNSCGVPRGTKINIGFTCDNTRAGTNTLIRYEDAMLNLDNAISTINDDIYLNGPCLEGYTELTDIAIDQSALKDKEGWKEQLRKCDNPITKRRFIEAREEEIIKKIEDVLDLANNMENKNLTDSERENFNNKLKEFITIIEEVRGSFKKIYDKIESPPEITYNEYGERINKVQNTLNIRAAE